LRRRRREGEENNKTQGERETKEMEGDKDRNQASHSGLTSGGRGGRKVEW
jgi:hypothetical protein